jgi:DNA repair photolyase
MTYWDLRKDIARVIPRQTLLLREGHVQKEKGRKSNYRQFDLRDRQMVTMERLLDTEGIDSFAEVSLRAQSCPMPFNVDLYDGLTCPYRCRYCFADYFRHSLYTSFFDNSKSLGIRHCAEDKWQAELDDLLPHVGEAVRGENTVLNSVRLRIPIRLGIRFEDFSAVERKRGISLKLLNYLADAGYPTMINTKSDLVGEPEYVAALARNAGRAAVHITMISADEAFNKLMEPGAPSFDRRIEAAKRLTSAGVRVVARVEPWMAFLNDDRKAVDLYIDGLKYAGIKHMTFDSYSYSAYSKGIASNFQDLGMDFDRMFLASSDSQWLSSYMLGKFIDVFRSRGLAVSTFDQGNVPDNDDWICCSVGDWFAEAGAGFNWGCGVVAIRFIQSRGAASTRWSDFERFVQGKGGWLSTALRREVQLLWNGAGDAAWPIYWAKGLTAAGSDEDGLVWTFAGDDFRENLLKGGALED